MARRDAPRIPGDARDARDAGNDGRDASPHDAIEGRSTADLREAVREVLRALDCLVTAQGGRGGPEARRHVDRAREVLAVSRGGPSRTTPATPPTSEKGGDIHEDLQRSLL